MAPVIFDKKKQLDLVAEKQASVQGAQAKTIVGANDGFDAQSKALAPGKKGDWNGDADFEKKLGVSSKQASEVASAQKSVMTNKLASVVGSAEASKMASEQASALTPVTVKLGSTQAAQVASEVASKQASVIAVQQGAQVASKQASPLGPVSPVVKQGTPVTASANKQASELAAVQASVTASEVALKQKTKAP